MNITVSRTPDIGLLHEAVEFRADQIGSHPAIDDGVKPISYAELRTQMERLAGVLWQHGVSRHARVGIFLENGIPAVTAMVGALRAGSCYVPLVPSFPPARNAMVAVDAELSALVTTKEHVNRLAELVPFLTGPKQPILIVLDRARAELEADEAFDALAGGFDPVLGQDDLADAPPLPQVETVEEDLAYIMYTSGTTGKPKGVMLSHRNVMSFLRWAVGYFDLSSRDRLSNHSNIGFDLSVFDIFGAFLAGATVCPILSAGDRAYPARFIRDRKITVWFSVPTVLGTMRAAKQLRRDLPFPSLRLATCCGESLPAEYAAAWLDAHPRIPLVNLYGPTEAAIACTFHKVGVDAPLVPDRAVPIGRPCRDTEILILKQDSDSLAAVNEIGRLLICGSQVSPGYWRLPELTQRAFRVNPYKKDFAGRMYESLDLAYRDTHGVIHFVGRADSQVKFLGYRIELGDIEAALQRFSSVREAAAVLLSSDPPELVGAVATNSAPEAAGEEILDHCAAILPPYMVPQRVVFFPALPRNANGKVDRNAIKERLVNQEPEVRGQGLGVNMESRAGV
jgi:amino acid adenylation domain-containing protein